MYIIHYDYTDTIIVLIYLMIVWIINIYRGMRYTRTIDPLSFSFVIS